MSIEKSKAAEVAMELIHAVGGVMDEKNIIGVCKVFTYIQEMVDKNWEQYIAGQTTEALAYDKIKCKCKREITISRSRQDIFYSIM